jgi:ketosteroid isomerase-like protein
VQALEDELAIHRLIVRYGIAADAGDAEAAAATFADDGTYDTDVGIMRGRAGVAAMLSGERHQGMVGRCAHQMGPAVVEIQGDRATAVGYSRVYLADGGRVGIYRVSTNRWRLERRQGQWRVVERTTRLLGHTEALMPFAGSETAQVP